jgi:predicted phage terminase large subunit-like protein
MRPSIDITSLPEEEQAELLTLLEEVRRNEALNKETEALQAERKRLASSFAEFAKAAWPILEPGNELSWSWHYDMIAEYLMLCVQKKIRRLIINIPPRTLKSLFVTIMFPVWVWTLDRENEDGSFVSLAKESFVCASYAQGLSEEHSVKRRRLIESAWFQNRWGEKVYLQKDQNQKSKFQNNMLAQMYATSVGGTLTGMGGNYLIVDDAIKPDEVASEPVLASLHTWFNNTWRSRLNNPAEDVMIIVEQRTGELDLTGHCMETDIKRVEQGGKPEWTVLCVPLEADEEAVDPKTLTQRFIYPISGTIKDRPLGDVLQPERFTPDVVSAWKVLRTIWCTQYQGRPTPLEGNLIKHADIRYYGGIDSVSGKHDRDLPTRFDLILTSTDATFKDATTSDFVCVGTIGVKGPDRYILEVTTNHLDAPATEKEINRQRTKWRARHHLIEDKANGPAIIASMRKKVPGVIPVDPQGGKLSRMYAVCGEWQSGNWYVDRNAAWTGPFIDHITKFPGIRHDDDVDMMTQAGVYIQSHGYSNGFARWIQGQEEELVAKRSGKFEKREEETSVSTVELSKVLMPSSLSKPTVGEIHATLRKYGEW